MAKVCVGSKDVAPRHSIVHAVSVPHRLHLTGKSARLGAGSAVLPVRLLDTDLLHGCYDAIAVTCRSLAR
jgi:hypothetical protein